MTNCNTCNSRYGAFAVYTVFSSLHLVSDIDDNSYNNDLWMLCRLGFEQSVAGPASWFGLTGTVWSAGECWASCRWDQCTKTCREENQRVTGPSPLYTAVLMHNVDLNGYSWC